MALTLSVLGVGLDMSRFMETLPFLFKEKIENHSKEELECMLEAMGKLTCGTESPQLEKTYSDGEGADSKSMNPCEEEVKRTEVGCECGKETR